MNKEEISKRSKAIAEFMGVDKCTDPDHEDNPCYYLNQMYQDISFAKYHLSWDCLMPVVEKISKEKFNDGDYIFPRTFGMVNKETENFMFRFNRHQLFQSESFIESVFLAVSDYCLNKTTPI